MATSAAWWKADRGDAHKRVWETTKYIRDQQRLQRLDLAIYLELYSAGNVAGLGRSLADISSYYAGKVHGLRGARFNMAAAVVDTAHSLIAANPPVPIYVTSGTNLATVRKAERRSKVLQSQMNELAQAVAPEAFHMACKTGTGIVYGCLDPDTGLPMLEHVNPLELLVEHCDGFYRQPRSIHRMRYVHKEHLKDLYPGKASWIDKASVEVEDYITNFLLSGVRYFGDMVTVIESWHIGHGKTKGRHTITVSNCDLKDEPFEDDEYPFAVVRYRNRAFGFFGAGLVESVREHQNRVNQLIRRVAKAQDLYSTLMIFNPDGENKINPRKISNELGLVFDFDGSLGKLELAKWDGTLEDLQAQIDLEFERVLRVEGLSDSQVSGEGAGKGLSSGVAVRAQDDVMSRRLVNPIKLFQQFNIEVARLIERLNNKAAANDNGYVAKGFSSDAGRTFLRSSRWRDLDIPDGEACINMMSMSVMPTTPAGKWAATMEWLQAGFIEAPMARKLLQFPAIDEYAALADAPIDLIRFQLEKLLDGEPVLPMERQPLDMCLQIGTLAWNQMMQMSPEDNVVDAFEEYLGYAQQMIDDAAASQQQVANVNDAAAQAAPGPAVGGIAAAPVAASAVPAAA